METGMEARRKSLIGWAILLFWYNLYVFLDFWFPIIQDFFPARDPFMNVFWITEKWAFDVDGLFYGLAYSPFPYLAILIFGFLFCVAPTALGIWWTVRLSRKWKSAGSE